MWDLLQGRPAAAPGLIAAALSSDGRAVAVAGFDGRVTWWDVASQKQLGEWQAAGPVRAVAFAPDGQELAVGNGNGSVSLFPLRALLRVERPAVEKLDDALRRLQTAQKVLGTARLRPQKDD